MPIVQTKLGTKYIESMVGSDRPPRGKNAMQSIGWIDPFLPYKGDYIGGRYMVW